MKKDGSWYFTTRDHGQDPDKVPYRPPSEPRIEQQGLEGCVKYEQTAAFAP